MWLFKRGCTKTRQDLALAGLGSCWGMSTARPGSAMGQSRSARRVPLEAPAFGENLGWGGKALGAKSTHLVDRSGSPYAFVRHLLWGSTCCLHCYLLPPCWRVPSCPIHALCWLCSSFDHMMSVTLKICAIQQVIKMWQMMRDTLWKNQPWLAGISTINKWMS